jgi:hypothetical protein
MRQRGINKGQVARALATPDLVEPDRLDPELTHAIKRFFYRGNSTMLRVVYNHTVVPSRVVTVFFDRKNR